MFCGSSRKTRISSLLRFSLYLAERIKRKVRTSVFSKKLAMSHIFSHIFNATVAMQSQSCRLRSHTTKAEETRKKSRRSSSRLTQFGRRPGLLLWRSSMYKEEALLRWRAEKTGVASRRSLRILRLGTVT